VHVGIDRGGEVATSARTTRRSALTSAAATWASLRGLIDDAATAAAAAAAAAPSTRATTSAVVAAGTTLGTLARPRAASARALVVVRSEPIAASAGEITLSIRMPPGYHFTKGANSRYEVEVVSAGGEATGEDTATAAASTAAPSPFTVEPTAGKLVDGQDVRLQFAATAGEVGAGGAGVEVRANCTVYFCREDDICLLQRVRFEVPVAAAGVREGAVALHFEVPAAAEVRAAPSSAPAGSSPIPSLDDL